ncbi:MAG: dihydrodipicolinate synthase family protein [Planctomycetales bacterium]|nr:dihydrodipicolinate synthase family protein [Planctomycetales bacterium]
MNRLTGLIAATYTPFDAAGSLCLSRVGPMVEQLLAQGVDGLFVCGSTGEGMSLSTAERKELAAEFAAANAGRSPLIVHVGHNSVADAAELARHAASCGAVAVSATCPSYYPIRSVDVLVDCMAQVAAGAPETPFYYYHIPVLTGVDLPMLEFLAKAAARIPNLVGVKFTKAAVHEYQACVALDDGRFDVLWGYDEMLLSALAVGAQGSVGSTYNIAAPLYQQMWTAFRAGDLARARQLQLRSVQMIQIVAQYPFHPAMKHILRWQGLDCGAARLPLEPLQPAQVESLKAQLEAGGFAELTRPPTSVAAAN